MENHLKTHRYFAADQLTVADIALYGYTHVADRCDFDLATFPAIRDWLRRMEQSPGFVAMDWTAEVGEVATLPPGLEPVKSGKTAGIAGTSINAAAILPQRHLSRRNVAGDRCDPASSRG